MKKYYWMIGLAILPVLTEPSAAGNWAKWTREEPYNLIRPNGP